MRGLIWRLVGAALAASVALTAHAQALSGGAAGATPGGSNTDIQYNSSGALAGSANLTFNGTNLIVGANAIEGSSDSITMNGAGGYTLSNPNNGWGINVAADYLDLTGGGSSQYHLLFSTDSGISRDSAGVFDFGSATYQDKSGTINAASLKLSSTLTTDVTGSTQCLQVNSSGVVSGSGASCGGGGGSGTVTSVAVTVPGILSVSGSPITSSGTFGITLATESENLVFAGPTTGSAATPTFRALVGADLPNPGASSLGGVESITSASHNWIAYIDTSGVPHQSQPACADLSTAAASCSTDTTNASNISSGTLGAARLPNPAASTLGGVESLASVSHKWINTISTSGVPAATQPACGDLSDSTAFCNGSVASFQGTTSSTFAAGNDSRFSALTQNGQCTYTLVIGDAGKSVYCNTSGTHTTTVPANSSVAFGIGTKVEIVNDCSAGTMTIAITSDTMVLSPSGATGSRTLAACGMATLEKVNTTRWMIVGSGLT